MEIKTEKLPNGIVIHAHGRIDSVTAPALETAVLPLIPNHKRLILNLQSVEFVSSAGLRVFLMIAKASTREQSRFVICGANESINDVIEMSGFGTILNVSATVAQALE